MKENPNTIQALTNAIVRADMWLSQASATDVSKVVPPAYLLAAMLNILAASNPAIKADEIKLNEPLPTTSSRRRTPNIGE